MHAKKKKNNNNNNELYTEFEFFEVLYIYSEDKNILEWFRIDPEGGP